MAAIRTPISHSFHLSLRHSVNNDQPETSEIAKYAINGAEEEAQLMRVVWKSIFNAKNSLFSKFSLFFPSHAIKRLWALKFRWLHESNQWIHSTTIPYRARFICNYFSSYSLISLPRFELLFAYRQRKFDFYLKLHSISTNWWAFELFAEHF